MPTSFWGAAIPCSGARPDWVDPNSDVVLWNRVDAPPPSPQPPGACVTEWSRVDAFQLPAEHEYYRCASR